MAGSVLVTAPTVEPITVADAKAHMRIGHNEDDALIAALITASRRLCETITRRALITQTWDLYLDAFPAGRAIQLPKSPLQSVTTVTYTDEDNTTTTFASTNYVVDTVSVPGCVVLTPSADWPSVNLWSVNAVKVRYVAGYGVATAIPETVKLAMKMVIGHWYEHREVQIESVPHTLELAVHALLSTERTWVYA